MPMAEYLTKTTSLTIIRIPAFIEEGNDINAFPYKDIDSLLDLEEEVIVEPARMKILKLLCRRVMCDGYPVQLLSRMLTGILPFSVSRHISRDGERHCDRQRPARSQKHLSNP